MFVNGQGHLDQVFSESFANSKVIDQVKGKLPASVSRVQERVRDNISELSEEPNLTVESMRNRIVLFELYNPRYATGMIVYMFLYMLSQGVIFGISIEGSLDDLWEMRDSVISYGLIVLVCVFLFTIFYYMVTSLFNWNRHSNFLSRMLLSPVTLFGITVLAFFVGNALVAWGLGGVDGPAFAALLTLSVLIISAPRVNSIVNYVTLISVVGVTVIAGDLFGFSQSFFDNHTLVSQIYEKRSLDMMVIEKLINTEYLERWLTIVGFLLSAISAPVIRHYASLPLNRHQTWTD